MQNNVEIIQINISGEDKPGMTSSLTEILARYDAFILDIGQANIHQSLTLGILIKTTSDKSGSIMKELLFKASELGVMIRFTPITEERYEDWVGRQGKNRYIITLLGRTVTARHIAEVTKVVAEHGLNIDAIKRLTGRMPLCEDDRAAKSCIELSVRGSLSDEERSTMQAGFMNLSDIGLDVSFQKDDIYRRSRRLICFDMDSTLIETEVIDELAERAGVGDEVRAITASAMRGEIDFRESFSRRVALLKGLDVSVMDEIARNLPITEGLERMMTILKRVGYKTAILSGGFTYFGNYLRQKYGFDYVYANELEIENGHLTGRYVGEVVDGRRKAAVPVRGDQHRAVGGCRRRRQRPADAQPRGSGHRLPRQTQGEGHGPAVDLDDRTGRHPLFPRPERFPHRSLTRYAPLPPHRRRLCRTSHGRVLRLPVRRAGRRRIGGTCDGDHRRPAGALRRDAVHGHGRHRGRREGHDQRPGGELLPHALHRGQ